MTVKPYIPEYITVHLGKPDSPAQNVTIPFSEYIKNVASSELYPTWPKEALKANIYAQISVALNRVYLEWYRSQGYDFDITNSTQYDQSFVYGRDIFENVSQIVDETFNDYITKKGKLEPFYAQYCDGRRVKCDGLYQWGSVDLAKEGYSARQILEYYFGDDISLIENAPIQSVKTSYPGSPMRLGDRGYNIFLIQTELNRISSNYPNIPKIFPVDGIFGDTTESAVKEFQKTFNLTPDGIVGKSTWYKLVYIYVAVKNLAELSSEGILLEEIPKQYSVLLQEGNQSQQVLLLQYYLDVISGFNPAIPSVNADGVFGSTTKNAVIAFQNNQGLYPTGEVDKTTWDAIYNNVVGIFNTVPIKSFYIPKLPYNNTVYKLGSQAFRVFFIQQYLSFISTYIPSIPEVKRDGVYGTKTEDAVKAFQTEFGLEPDGIVGEKTWTKLDDIYTDLRSGANRSLGQNPGTELKEEY